VPPSLRSLLLVAGCVPYLAGASAPAPPEALVRDPGAQAQADVRSEYGAGFRVLETDHFRVISDTSLRYHTVVTGVLEQFHQQVQPRFFEREIERLPFYLINGGRDFDRFVESRGLRGGTTYGFYVSETRSLYARRYFADGRESGVGTLFHEAIHAMMHAELGSMEAAPAWLHEGFASLFEAGRLLRGEWVYGNPNPWRETPFRAEFEAGRVPPLGAYFRLTDEEFQGPKRDLHYATGRSFFLYLLLNHGESAIRRFIRSIRDQQDAAAALVDVTGLDLAEVESRWHRSIREVNFAGDYLNRGGGANGLAILQEGAAKFPGYGNLQATLAARYLERGDRERAQRHARLALDDPRCILPQLANSVLARAIVATDPAEAARALVTAIGYQPWSEQVMEGEMRMLASMYAAVGDAARAAAVNSEVERLERLDSTAVQPR
jgi:hypothetical protein